MEPTREDLHNVIHFLIDAYIKDAHKEQRQLSFPDLFHYLSTSDVSPRGPLHDTTDELN